MRRAVVVEDAVGGVHADHDIGLELVDLVMQPARFRLRHRLLAGEAARVAAGLLGPVSLRIALPVRRREIAVEVDAVAIDALWRVGEQAVRIGDRDDAPVVLAGFAVGFVQPLQPAEDDRGGGQLVAMDAADQQDASGAGGHLAGLGDLAGGRRDVARHQGVALSRNKA